MGEGLLVNGELFSTVLVLGFPSCIVMRMDPTAFVQNQWQSHEWI